MIKRKNYVQIWVDPLTKNRVWRIKANTPNKTIKQILDDALADAEKKLGGKRKDDFFPQM